MTIVAITGIDGCGKTTQAKLLVSRLEKAGYQAIYVQPARHLLNILPRPTRSEGKNIPSLISPRKARTSQMANSDRHEGILSGIRRLLIGLLGYPYALASYMVIKFYLSWNKIVVCDRYFYQFFFDLFGGLSKKVIRVFPKPDITFFLDGDLDVFYSRMNSPSDATVSRDYYMSVTNLYRELSQRYRMIQLDANLDAETVNDLIFRHVWEEMKEGTQ